MGLLLLDTELLEQEGILERILFVVIISATRAKMSSSHVGLHEQHRVVGLERAQLGTELGRLPVLHSRVVQAGLDEHVGVVLCLEVVVRRVAQHVLVLLLDVWVAPLLPFGHGQWNVLVEQRADDINERLS